MAQTQGTVRRVRVSVPPGSPAWFAPLIEFSDGSVGFGDYDFPEMEPQNDDEEYVVQANDTMARIANRRYGTPELDYVIMLRNGRFSLSAAEMEKGETLVLPSPLYVRQLFVERR
jgi:nucleoid-associated protein YgaU